MVLEDDYSKSEKIKLYRKRDDGSVGIVELSRGMFADEDAFMEAVDFKYAEGYVDSYKEAMEGASDSFSM